MKDRERTPSFLFPRDGDVMVGGADGAVCDGGLMITAVIAAPAGAAVLVNGMPARRNAEGLFEADVLLDGPPHLLERGRNGHGVCFLASLAHLSLYSGRFYPLVSKPERTSGCIRLHFRGPLPRALSGCTPSLGKQGTHERFLRDGRRGF